MFIVQAILNWVFCTLWPKTSSQIKNIIKWGLGSSGPLRAFSICSLPQVRINYIFLSQGSTVAVTAKSLQDSPCEAGSCGSYGGALLRSPFKEELVMWLPFRAEPMFFTGSIVGVPGHGHFCQHRTPPTSSLSSRAFSYPILLPFFVFPWYHHPSSHLP